MKKRCCQICNFYLAPQIEGDYCVECLSFNIFLVGDCRVDDMTSTYIRANWNKLFRRNATKLNVEFVAGK